MLTRRCFLAGVGGGVLVGVAPASAATLSTMKQRLAALEERVGGAIGLAALNTGSGVRIAYRADERFAMCSTFKLMLAAVVLSRVDEGSLRLEQPVPVSRSQLLPNSPIADVHPQGGTVALAAMLQSMIEASDNTAANRLLALVGGPLGYTAYLRGIGDATTRLDRVELGLNSNLSGDLRDTTSPNAMLDDMSRVLIGELLSKASRERLLNWMRDCRTGHDRLRARLPADWVAGDKTGSGARGAINDLAIFFPPHRDPILVACYLTGSTASLDVLNGVHAHIGAWIADALSEPTAGTGKV